MEHLTVTLNDGSTIEIEDYNGTKEVEDGYLILYRAYHNPEVVAIENIDPFERMILVY